MTTLKEWCRANWNKIGDEPRKEMLDYLDDWLFKNNPEKDKNLAYLRGYDSDVFFHFSSGMAIRNKLREKYSDEYLPNIEFSMEGHPYDASNWDDYYTGAIDELLERYP